MDATIKDFRRFNRLYTRVLGLFNRHLLGSPLTLAQARILFEIAAAPGCSSSDLTRELGMDRGQLSRIVAQLVERSLVERPTGPSGRKTVPLTPTNEGKRLLATIERAANEQARELLEPLGGKERLRLRSALHEVRTLLGMPDADLDEYVIRPVKPGELGWIATRHAELYGDACGFDGDFERYVLLGLADYLERGGDRSAVWVAERGGVPVGSVGIVEARQDRNTRKGKPRKLSFRSRPEACAAQLRWLLVEPWSRKEGIGRRLVEHAVDFSRDQGYGKIFFWTLEHLAPARGLYQSLGFELVESQEGVMGGQNVREEYWELALD